MAVCAALHSATAPGRTRRRESLIICFSRLEAVPQTCLAVSDQTGHISQFQQCHRLVPPHGIRKASQLWHQPLKLSRYPRKTHASVEYLRQHAGPGQDSNPAKQYSTQLHVAANVRRGKPNLSLAHPLTFHSSCKMIFHPAQRIFHPQKA